MRRREEVAYLAFRIRNGIESSSVTLRECAVDAVNDLSHIALESIPTRYTPREEVTEGWWSALFIYQEQRCFIWVTRDRQGCLCVEVVGTELTYELTDFTDFLPVPAWLVEGIKAEGRERE